MGRYRKLVMEVAETGVTMARARASATASAGRKRKVECEGEVNYSTSLLQLRSPRRRVAVTPENTTENAAASNSNERCASCCSSNGSSELDNDASKFVDLEETEEESAEIATSTYELENCREGRETTQSSEVHPELDELESTAVRPPSSEAVSSRRRSAGDKMPSEAELEEFFSAAEKELHQQFAQKYNFDPVKEEPLEGRYEWVRVKP